MNERPPTRREFIQSTSTVCLPLVVPQQRNDQPTHVPVEQLLGVDLFRDGSTRGEVHVREVGRDEGWMTVLQETVVEGSSTVIGEGAFALSVAHPNATDSIQSVYEEYRARFESYVEHPRYSVKRSEADSVAGHRGTVAHVRRKPRFSDIGLTEVSMVQTLPFGLLLWDLMWHPDWSVANAEMIDRHREWLRPRIKRISQSLMLGIRERWHDLYTSGANLKQVSVGDVGELSEDLNHISSSLSESIEGWDEGSEVVCSYTTVAEDQFDSHRDNP